MLYLLFSYYISLSKKKGVRNRNMLRFILHLLFVTTILFDLRSNFGEKNVLTKAVVIKIEGLVLAQNEMLTENATKGGNVIQAFREQLIQITAMR